MPRKPYHNFSHAVDVTHTVWLYMTFQQAHKFLSATDQASCNATRMIWCVQRSAAWHGTVWYDECIESHKVRTTANPRGKHPHD